MQKNSRDILKFWDDETNLEYPKNFDRESLARKVSCFADELSAVLGRCLPIDNMVQDASYYCIIELQSFFIGTNKTFVHGIRFSNFGYMCTYLREDIPDSEALTIDRLLKQHGFVFIPMEDLETPYDGKMSYRSSIPNWWTRFFDYF